MGAVRSYYPFGDDLETGQNCKIWQELPMPADPVRAEKRKKMKELLFKAAFSTYEDENGNSLIPFHALADHEVEALPSDVRNEYLMSLQAAKDPRSGMIVIPSPLEATEATREAG